MRTISFAGYSDDTFGENTKSGDDYDNCASGKPIEYLIESASEGRKIIVFGQYAPSAYTEGWVVGIAAAEESDVNPIPPWPIRIRAPTGQETPYSPVLEIDVPDDAKLRCLRRDGDDE